VPPGHVVRTFTVEATLTPAQRRRAMAMLESGGDVLAFCIDRFHARIRAGLPNANSVVELWPDQKAHGPFGELSAHCAQDVTKLWSAQYFEAIRRRQSGARAALPLKKRRLVPITWRKGEFALVAPADGRRARAELSCARGRPKLVLRLSHPHRFEEALVRSVRLREDAGDLLVDITAFVGVASASLDPLLVAGVDPGIIHPLAVAVGDTALLISGRALRAEEFLHLEDSKARARISSTKRAAVRARPGRPSEGGSRRWRKLQAAQRAAESRNRRVVKLAQHRAARLATSLIVASRASEVAVGDPRGIESAPAGRVHRRRVHRWGRAYGRDALRYALEEAGIKVRLVEERGTSSRCPHCAAPATKSGRRLRCSSLTCTAVHHRDIAGAQNMVVKIGHAPRKIARTEHRRVGQPSRRDRRRHLYDLSRSAQAAPLGPARTRAADPARAGEESLVAQVARARVIVFA